MTKLYVIKCSRVNADTSVEELGYISDTTELDQNSFSVEFIQPLGLHACNHHIVTFFSPALAQKICDKITQQSNAKYPNNVIEFRVVGESFSSDEVTVYASKRYIFESDSDGDK